MITHSHYKDSKKQRQHGGRVSTNIDALSVSVCCSSVFVTLCVTCNIYVDAGKMFENTTKRPLTTVVRALRCRLMPVNQCKQESRNV